MTAPPQSPAASAVLQSLVPLALRQELAGGVAPTGATCRRHDAVVLVADVSGFSVLAEEFARRGPRGAEDLKDVLNAVFGRLADLVEQHGGDVLRFAGDALIGSWTIDGDGQPAIAAACACALSAQRELGAMVLDRGYRPRLRVGVGHGALDMARVGGVADRWELVAWGEALSRAFAASEVARPGEAVAARTALAVLGDAVTVDDADAEHARLVSIVGVALPHVDAPRLDAAAERSLRMYVPRSIQGKIDAGLGGWLAEFRHLNVLFVRLDGIGDGGRTRLEDTQRGLVAVQAAVHRFDGSLAQFVVDDKGTVAVCAWGLAMHAHDDDAARAVRAASAIVDSLRGSGLGASCGVTTGATYTGLRGSATRAEFALIGGVVNLAARLMVAAEGGVLVDDETARLARRHMAFETLPAIHVKGRAEPVVVHRPAEGDGSDAEPVSGLVGRIAERRIFSDRIGMLVDGGRGGLLVLEGEAGMGKTRLLGELRRLAAAAGVRTHAAKGDLIERATAYHPWRQLFTDLLSPGGEPAAVAERVVGILGGDSHHASLLSLLDPVLGTNFPETERAARLTPRGRSELTRRLLLDLYASAASGAPAVIILEDAHWFDSASCGFADALRTERPDVLLVVGTRPLTPDEDTLELRRLVDAPDAQRIVIGGLEEDDTASLMAARLGVERVHDEVVRLVFEKAEGRPFFTEELTESLRERGLLGVAGGSARFATADAARTALDLPNTIQGLVASRLDRLSSAEQFTVKVASVLGRSFEVAAVHAVHPIGSDCDSIDQQLVEAVAHGICRRVGVAAYEFGHAITRDVAYGLLSYEQRRTLHSATGAWIEREHAGALEPVYATLAHHWPNAEHREKSMVYLELAGEQAFERNASEEAVRFFTQLLGIAGEEEGGVGARRVRWRRHLGESLTNLGMFGRAREEFGRMLAGMGHPLPVTSRSLAARVALEVAVQARHRLLPARERVHRPDDSDQFREAARAYIRLCNMAYVAGNTVELFYMQLRAMNVAERRTPTAELAIAYADAGNICGMIPLHRAARAYSTLALDAAATLAEPVALARVLGRTAIYRAAIADWSACDDGERALSLAEEVGDSYQWEETAIVLARAWLVRGDYERARSLAAAAQARVVTSRVAVHQVWGLASEAGATLMLGDPNRALALALEGLAQHEASGRRDRLSVIDLCASIARAHLALGEDGDALRATERLHRAIDESPRPGHLAVFAMAGAVEAWLTLSERAPTPERRRAALASARAAHRHLHAYARINPPAAVPAALWLAELELHAGRRREARAALSRAMAGAATFGLQREAGLARDLVQRHFGPSSTDEVATGPSTTR